MLTTGASATEPDAQFLDHRNAFVLRTAEVQVRSASTFMPAAPAAPW
ncbi:MAG: hypothetical protein U1F49_15090 [Rubrivivax sp.]